MMLLQENLTNGVMIFNLFTLEIGNYETVKCLCFSEFQNKFKNEMRFH